VTDGGGSARQAALDAIRRARQGPLFLRDALHAIFQETHLSARDRALATQLAAGVLRHRRTLRLLVGHARGQGRRAGTIQPALLGVLELGVFQLLFLDRVPAYAAVNESVEAARRAARSPGAARKTAGFVNGVLRAVERLIVGREPAGTPAADALPHPEGGVVRLAAPLLPDPATDRAAFLGAAYSYPDWLVARWAAHFGPEQAEEICRWGNRRPATCARINPMGAGADDLLNRLQEETLGVAPGPQPGTLDVSALPADRLERLCAEGRLAVQDPSSMIAVEMLAPKAGEAVLDLCASPGTKTTQIVEAMGDRGRVVACDRSEEKIGALRRVLAERRIESVTVCLSEEAAGAGPPGGFDAALVDAPCSNTGVLARRVEARWRLRAPDLEELAALQAALLQRAAAMVRPGGRLLYATCSLEPEENDGQVRAFLAERPDWTAEARRQAFPAADHDGSFAALLVRAARPAG
jgi:16S rRNA (cytosine967-C5)-methyltransferase